MKWQEEIQRAVSNMTYEEVMKKYNVNKLEAARAKKGKATPTFLDKHLQSLGYEKELPNFVALQLIVGNMSNQREIARKTGISVSAIQKILTAIYTADELEEQSLLPHLANKTALALFETYANGADLNYFITYFEGVKS